MAAAAAAADDVIRLSSGDEKLFEVKRSVAEMSEMLKALLADIPDNTAIVPVKNVEGKILAKVIEYCLQHDRLKGVAGTEEELKQFDDEFVKVDQATMFELLKAANYLDIKELMDLCCLTVANMIKGKTPEEIRTTFHIKNDFTAEEEEEVRRENTWAFE